MKETVDGTRYSWYRAPDPSWAPRETISKVRAALKSMDQKLDLWWVPDWRPNDSEHPGRWGVVYWMARASRWSPVFYWEGPAGEWREITTECIDTILRMLSEIDAERPGGDVYSIERAKEFLTKKTEEQNKRDFQEILREHARDYGRRLAGQLVTIGPGGPRSRAGLGEDADFEAEMRKRGIR